MMNDKVAETVRLATVKILDASDRLLNNRKIKNVLTDDGSEFKQAFQNLLRQRNINGIISKSKLKAQIVERFIRTLKLNLAKAMAIYATKRYIDLLPRVLYKYNYISKHRTVRMTPYEASQPRNEAALKPIFNKVRPIVRTRFRIADQVRIVEDKNIFSRGWHSNFSPALYTITHINRKAPVTFKVADYNNNILPRAYYESELIKTKVCNFHLCFYFYISSMLDFFHFCVYITLVYSSSFKILICNRCQTIF